MNRTAYALTAAVLATGTFAACTFRTVSVGYYDDHPRHHAVYVDHVCSYECDNHYWDGHRLVVLESGHHHHPGCGHAWDGRHWVTVHDDHPGVVISKAPARRVHRSPTRARRVTHVHSATCGCAWDRRERVWVTLEHGHVHGRNCGHMYVTGKWCLAR